MPVIVRLRMRRLLALAMGVELLSEIATMSRCSSVSGNRNDSKHVAFK